MLDGGFVLVLVLETSRGTGRSSMAGTARDTTPSPCANRADVEDEHEDESNVVSPVAAQRSCRTGIDPQAPRDLLAFNTNTVQRPLRAAEGEADAVDARGAAREGHHERPDAPRLSWHRCLHRSSTPCAMRHTDDGGFLSHRGRAARGRGVLWTPDGKTCRLKVDICCR